MTIPDLQSDFPGSLISLLSFQKFVKIKVFSIGERNFRKIHINESRYFNAMESLDKMFASARSKIKYSVINDFYLHSSKIYRHFTTLKSLMCIPEQRIAFRIFNLACSISE